MASGHSFKGYGNPATRSLYFDGDEAKYEMWEERMIGYMKVKNLKEVILPGTIASVDRKEQCYAELIQFLDERSLCLVMREAKDDGRRALEILRQHYAGHSEPRIMSLYGQLSSLTMKNNEDVTAYTIRAETIATALKATGEVVSDRLLNASVMKGLPHSYEAFIVNINASQKAVTFTEFKVQLRNFEENKRANIAHRQQHGETELDGIMQMKHMSISQNNGHHHPDKSRDTGDEGDHHISRHHNGQNWNNNGFPTGQLNGRGNNNNREGSRFNGRNNSNNNNRGSPRNSTWCNVHRTDSHSTAECRSLQQQQQPTTRREDYRGRDDYHRMDSTNHVNDYEYDNRGTSPSFSDDNHSYIFAASDENENTCCK